MNRRIFLSLLPIPFIVKPKPRKLFKWNMHPAQEKFFYNSIKTMYVPFMGGYR